MSNMLFQARAGDGVKKRRLKRADTFFRTPEEAVNEALGLKERMDHTYENKIAWDYQTDPRGSNSKMKILKGYLDGNRNSNPFYLEISLDEHNDINPVAPLKPKTVSKEDKLIINNVISFYK